MSLVLLEHGLDALAPPGGGVLYRHPLAVVTAAAAADVPAALDRLAAATAAGLTACGFLAYELGYALEPRLRSLLPAARTLPLLWFGLYRRGEPLADVDAWLAAHTDREVTEPRLTPLGPALDRDGYRRRFARVKDWIDAGDAYQINLTFAEDFAFDGDPIALYRRLRRQQPVARGALLRLGPLAILSFSPELFIATGGGTITVRPMKGTAARGPTAALDAERAQALAADAKTRAENLMIVDLLRNDVGRVSACGSVRVTDLYTVETLPTLHQMTSGITARLRADATPATMVRGLFPCGSVTGAPKIRAMQIIRELEDGPRGVYTGAIGRFGPGGDATLNVAIRTLVLRCGGRGATEGGGGRGVLGVGSGIVFDSDADAEYAECRLKARFLAPPDADFQLVETLCWQRPGGYPRLALHLDRLARSAAWFGFAADTAAIAQRLAAAAAAFTDDRLRVRLLLAADGTTRIDSQPLPPPPARLRATLRPQPRRLDDPFLYHKTTRRAPYDAALAAVRAEGGDEVIFVNGRGELTEGAWTNLFVETGGLLLTPPVACGLLAGTLRQHLLASEPGRVRERLLRPADLAAAERIWLGNGVRGLMAAEIV